MLWEFGSRVIPNILGVEDLDFMLIDMEHSTFDAQSNRMAQADFAVLIRALPRNAVWPDLRVA